MHIKKHLGFDALKWFFSTGPMLKILGTELQHTAAVAAIKAHDTEETKNYWRYLSVATMTKTPLTWGLWNKEYYHNRIKNIKVPVLLLAGEHEHLIGFDDNSMSEDVKRIGKLAYLRQFAQTPRNRDDPFFWRRVAVLSMIRLEKQIGDANR